MKEGELARTYRASCKQEDPSIAKYYGRLTKYGRTKKRQKREKEGRACEKVNHVLAFRAILCCVLFSRCGDRGVTEISGTPPPQTADDANSKRRTRW